MDGNGDNGRVDTTMAVARVPTPPPMDLLCPMAENWCYTQVRNCFFLGFYGMIVRMELDAVF